MLDFSRIGCYRENNRIEAKLAHGGLPESIWETYSAFANTLGGYILLGVTENSDKSLRICDLECPETLIEEFWRVYYGSDKVSARLLAPEDVWVQEVGGDRIVVIRVPRAKNADRPVYIDGNRVSGTFRRGGEGDRKCTASEIDAMLRTRTQKSSPAEQLLPYRSAVISYMTERAHVRVGEVADYLDVSREEARIILSALAEEGVAEVAGSPQSRHYRLKV